MRIIATNPATQAIIDKHRLEKPAEWDKRIERNRLARRVQAEFERVLELEMNKGINV